MSYSAANRICIPCPLLKQLSFLSLQFPTWRLSKTQDLGGSRTSVIRNRLGLQILSLFLHPNMTQHYRPLLSPQEPLNLLCPTGLTTKCDRPHILFFLLKGGRWVGRASEATPHILKLAHNPRWWHITEWRGCDKPLKCGSKWILSWWSVFSKCPYVLLPLDLKSGTSFLHGGREGVVVVKLSKLSYKCPAGPRHESGFQPYHALHMALLLMKSQLNTCLFFQLWEKSEAPKLQQLVQRSPWHLHPSGGCLWAMVYTFLVHVAEEHRAICGVNASLQPSRYWAMLPQPGRPWWLLCMQTLMNCLPRDRTANKQEIN